MNYLSIFFVQQQTFEFFIFIFIFILFGNFHPAGEKAMTKQNIQR